MKLPKSLEIKNKEQVNKITDCVIVILGILLIIIAMILLNYQTRTDIYKLNEIYLSNDLGLCNNCLVLNVSNESGSFIFYWYSRHNELNIPKGAVISIEFLKERNGNFWYISKVNEVKNE